MISRKKEWHTCMMYVYARIVDAYSEIYPDLTKRRGVIFP